MRLSKNQRNTLLILYSIEKKTNKHQVIPVVDLLKIINKVRNKDVSANHFRQSCLVLSQNGYLHQHRNEKFRISYSLTQKGREKANLIYEEATLD
ncbi:hypothetical protein [Dickeya sp. NCPPB 3274]|uniref:hypothetical protein n=1 Tax=Dickeya sp. NCPPB 3274 TaxID=568766 RepID=UPI0005B40E66|nr:hypothetical protein [Dickeya sp. NCPPB 3274]